MKKITAGLLATAMLTTGAFAADIESTDSVGGRSITAFDRVGQRKLGGYFDTEFVSQGAGQTFKAHRMVLQASSQVHEKILFNTEIEFEYGGQVNGITDGDADDNTDGEIKIEQAWVDFEYAEDNYLRTGIVLVPFGRVNILHDSDVRDTTNRPIYAKYIVPSTWMDTGVGGHGRFDVQDWAFNYEAYVVNGLTDAISGTNGVRSARPGFKSDNNQASALAARVGVSPMLGLEVGTSLYTGVYDDEDTDGITMVGLDAAWKNGPYEVISEWAQASIDGGSDVPDKMDGYYVEAHYHFFPSFLKNAFFAKGFDRPTFTAFARYGEVDLDTSTTDSYDRSQTTIGLNYRPIESAVIKVEVELNDAEEDADSLANAIYASVAVGF